MIIDIIFLAIIIIAFGFGYKQGFLKSVRGIVAWVITAIVVYSALTPATAFLGKTQIAEKIYNSVYQSISQKADIENTDTMSSISTLPEWIVKSGDVQKAVDNISSGIDNVASSTAKSITDLAIKIIAIIVLFIAIRFILFIIFRLLDDIFTLPILNGINRLFGAVFGVVSILFAIHIVLALVTLFANPSIYAYLNNSTIVRYMFNNNILMTFFIK